MIKYKRSNGSVIELKDTPQMAEFAKSQNWEKVKPKKVKKDARNSGTNNT